MTNKTKELNFNAVRELPAVNNIINKKQRTTSAKQKVKSAENRFKGKGKGEQRTALPTSFETTAISYEAIIAEPEVEPLNMEYINLILGKKKLDTAVKEKALEMINGVILNNNPTIAEHFRDMCINVIDTMYSSGSRIALKDYINACLFVTYRQAGDSKIRAYTKVFPERVMRLQKEGQNMAHLNVYADIYSKGQAVVDVQAKTMLPAHLLCHDLFYEAMRVTADIMNDDKVSPKVRVDAANNIMNYTKQPEIKKQELDISIKDSDEIAQLKEALFSLSQQQRDNIIEGTATVVDVTNQLIYSEDDDE